MVVVDLLVVVVVCRWEWRGVIWSKTNPGRPPAELFPLPSRDGGVVLKPDTPAFTGATETLKKR